MDVHVGIVNIRVRRGLVPLSVSLIACTHAASPPRCLSPAVPSATGRCCALQGDICPLVPSYVYSHGQHRQGCLSWHGTPMDMVGIIGIYPYISVSIQPAGSTGNSINNVIYFLIALEIEFPLV